MSATRPALTTAGWLRLALTAVLLQPASLFVQLAPPPAGQSTAPVQPATPGLAPPLPSVSSPHLDATPSVIFAKDRPSGDRFAKGRDSGDRVTLVVTVTPKPGVHVYAPGNPSYAAVALNIEPPPAGTIGPAVHPKAETYFFAPLNERVLVYGSTFRLTRELKAGPEGLPRLVLGALEYQACDDKVCYRPQTLPLTWKIDK
jgi:hypothetical protein